MTDENEKGPEGEPSEEEVRKVLAQHTCENYAQVTLCEHELGVLSLGYAMAQVEANVAKNALPPDVAEALAEAYKEGMRMAPLAMHASISRKLTKALQGARPGLEQQVKEQVEATGGDVLESIKESLRKDGRLDEEGPQWPGLDGPLFV